MTSRFRRLSVALHIMALLIGGLACGADDSQPGLRGSVPGFVELDEDVVPAHGNAGVAFELASEHVDERECALEVEPPGAQALGRGT